MTDNLEAAGEAYRRRTAIHEASHGVIAKVLGRSVQFLSIRPGAHYGGVTVYRYRARAPHDYDVVTRPAILWPVRTRRMLEIKAFVSLAGPVGELYLAEYVTGYVAQIPDEDDAEAAAETLARLHPATRSAVQQVETSDPLPSDEQQAQAASCALVGTQEAAAWVGWARMSVAHLVAEHASQIQAVADELLLATVISGRRMQAVLRSNDRKTGDTP